MTDTLQPPDSGPAAPSSSASAPLGQSTGQVDADLLALLQSIDDQVAAYDDEWRYAFVNSAASRALGRPPEQLLGRSVWEVFPEAVGDEYYRELHEARATGRTIHSEHFLAPADRWFERHIYPTPHGVTVFSTDVTWRKQAEAALAASSRRFTEVIEQIGDSFTALSTDWCITYMNGTAVRWSQLEAAPVGRNFWEVFPFGDASAFGDALRRVMSQRVAEVVEAPSPRSGRWYESSIFPTDDGIAVLSRDIHVRKQAEAALLAADRRKDEFLATLGHELRNPLAPIRTAIQLLRRIGHTDPVVVRAHDIIDRQVEQLTRLVDDLLDVSRITRGQVELRKRDVEVRAIVEHGIESALPLIEARQHLLATALDGAPLWVHGDPSRLEQVVANLLHNAAKYTPEGGRVSVSTWAEDDEVVIEVSDNGRGLASDALEHIFELFGQVNRHTAHGGLGIGLTIARELVQRHGGSLRAASNGPDQGATFMVRLPRVGAPAPAEPGGPADQPSPAPAWPVGAARRILVVDDNRDAADSLATMLTRAGHDVRVAYDGGTAVQLARASVPDIVFLDIGLPGISGYDVARDLRRDDTFARTRLVAVTGWSQPEDRRKARDAGFDTHLIKPVDDETIARLIATSRS